ncbi:guanine deaminase [bacterium]|nr:guanine deaminase [bacterium]
MGKRYRGAILNPINRNDIEFFQSGFLDVDDNGRIEAVGDLGDAAEGDFEGNLLIIPAFVDIHTHLPQFDVRGTFSGNELLPWLKDYIWPEEAKCADLGHVKDIAERFYRDLIKHGTLTAGIYGTIHESAVCEMIDLMPIRGRLGKVIMDANSPENLSETTEESLEITERLCKKYGDKHVVTPRFAPSCSFESMKKAAEIAHKYDCFIQTHLSENKDEIAWVKELFPDAKNYTDVYYKAGLLGPKTIVGHAVHCDDDELETLKKTGTKIAHCPTSNEALKSGTMPLDKIIKFGIPFALATDVGAGPKTSMLDVMRCFLNVHGSGHNGLRNSPNVSPVSALYYATLAGAEVLGYGDETGNFKKGKSADFLVLDIKVVSGEKPDEIIRKLTHESDYDSIVKEAYLGGRKLN